MDAGGYVTEISYTYAHHGEMAPARLALALILAGVAPPPGLLTGRDFTWCELGFGQGVTLAVLAASCPGAHFHGTDINPEHVGFIRDISDRAGLGNLTVAADGFGTYGQRAGLPQFDVVALHGIWSWVGPSQRAEIVAFLRDRLKPGGVCYMGYNALPGLAPLLPVRKLMKVHLDRDTGPIVDRIPRAVAFANRLRTWGARHFVACPQAGERLQSLVGRPVAYLAHEYFNEHWTPDHVTDVAAALGQAGLELVGPSRVADRLDTPVTGPLADGIAALLAEVDDPLLRELAGDFMTNRPFRRDLFVKQPDRLTVAMRERMLADMPFAALVLPHRMPGGGMLPHGEAVLDRDAGTTLLERLLDKPRPAGRPALLPTALGQAVPAVDPDGIQDRLESCVRFNKVALELSLADDKVGALASPVLGAGVDLDRIERLFLLARRNGVEPPTFALEAMIGSGGAVERDGRKLTETDALEELDDRWVRFRNTRLPVLERLGVA